VDRVVVHGELQQQVGIRLAQLVLDRVRIRRPELLDLAGAPGIGRARGRILLPVEAVDHVLGSELLAAAELHVVAKLEGVELSIRAHRPGLGQQGHGSLAVPVQRHQRVLDQVDDVGGGRPAGTVPVEVGRIARFRHGESLCLDRRHGGGQRERGGGEEFLHAFSGLL